MKASSGWQKKEQEARWAIEQLGFCVHDANVLFRANCPNIDLVVFGRKKAVYVQVKSSEHAAGKDCVVVDGSPWTREQLYNDAPIFNKHPVSENYEADFVLVIERSKSGESDFYIIPPKKLEKLLLERGRAWAQTPKRDGAPRSINFRKELPREMLMPWKGAAALLAELV